MIIPSILISFATFPGVIVHELAHRLFCWWFRIPVFDVCYFRFDNPVGYVLHEIPSKTYQSVLVSTGPFIINTVLAFLISFPAAIRYRLDGATPFTTLLLYLGISIGAHAFPSTGDASAMWDSVMHGTTSSRLNRILVAPIVGFIYVGAIGSVFWLDILYGLAVALILPQRLVALFA